MIHACTFSIAPSPQIPDLGLSDALLHRPVYPPHPRDPEVATTTSQRPEHAISSLLPRFQPTNAKTNESEVFTMAQFHEDTATSSDRPADLQPHVPHKGDLFSTGKALSPTGAQYAAKRRLSFYTN